MGNLVPEAGARRTKWPVGLMQVGSRFENLPGHALLEATILWASRIHGGIIKICKMQNVLPYMEIEKHLHYTIS